MVLLYTFALVKNGLLLTLSKRFGAVRFYSLESITYLAPLSYIWTLYK